MKLRPEGLCEDGKSVEEGRNQVDSLEKEVSYLKSIIQNQQDELLGLYRSLHRYQDPQMTRPY